MSKRRRRKVIALPPSPKLIRRWRREGVTEQRFRSLPACTRRSLLSLWRLTGQACPHGLPGRWCRRCGFPSNAQVLAMSEARRQAALDRELLHGMTSLTPSERAAWDRAIATGQRIVTEWRAARRGGRYEP